MGVAPDFCLLPSAFCLLPSPYGLLTTDYGPRTSMAFIDADYGLEYNPLAAQAREMRLPETQPHDQVQQLRDQ
jgi:hypothetical protein